MLLVHITTVLSLFGEQETSRAGIARQRILAKNFMVSFYQIEALTAIPCAFMKAHGMKKKAGFRKHEVCFMVFQKPACYSGHLKIFRRKPLLAHLFCNIIDCLVYDFDVFFVNA